MNDRGRVACLVARYPRSQFILVRAHKLRTALTMFGIGWGIVSITLMVAAGAFGLAEYAGAHPFWSGRVVYIGVPLGLILAWAVRRAGLGRGMRLGLYLLGTVVLVSLAFWGKAQFAASFAEDRFAGQVWYFGWIGAAMFATALLARLLSRN